MAWERRGTVIGREGSDKGNRIKLDGGGGGEDVRRDCSLCACLVRCVPASRRIVRDFSRLELDVALGQAGPLAHRLCSPAFLSSASLLLAGACPAGPSCRPRARSLRRLAAAACAALPRIPASIDRSLLLPSHDTRSSTRSHGQGRHQNEREATRRPTNPQRSSLSFSLGCAQLEPPSLLSYLFGLTVLIVGVIAPVVYVVVKNRNPHTSAAHEQRD